MAKIRVVEIQNFRSIKSLTWYPDGGINCLIGPGDSGKSTVLEAIDICLTARRTLAFSDADFHALDVARPISISVTIGELDDSLLSIESYGQYLRSYNDFFNELSDEPEMNGEPVLTLNLRVEQDLEPVWTLYSERAAAQQVAKGLAWKDRARIAPTRLGTHPGLNLSWSRGSVLNRLAEEKPQVSLALVEAAREARLSFGDAADAQLKGTLDIVSRTAKSLGVRVNARALLDAHAVSFSDGAIALHNGEGIPLRGLGTGSSRLLIAGLQREAAEESSIILVDEVEFGLEPHRLTRLLGSLGAKEKAPKLQVFMTTHSPVALRELNGDQLFVLRRTMENHEIRRVGSSNEMQSALRSTPSAFLCTTVIVCEGPSEVGLIRGLDQHRVSLGALSLNANGVSYMNAEGSTPDKCLEKATSLRRLGYRVMAFIDNDKPATPAIIAKFKELGGELVTWREGHALEDELFLSVEDAQVSELIERAKELLEEGLVEKHIESSSNGKTRLDDIESRFIAHGYEPDTRTLLGKAARSKKGWFKTIDKMEGVARDIIGPNLKHCDKGFQATVTHLFDWANDDLI